MHHVALIPLPTSFKIVSLMKYTAVCAARGAHVFWRRGFLMSRRMKSLVSCYPRTKKILVYRDHIFVEVDWLNIWEWKHRSYWTQQEVHARRVAMNDQKQGRANRDVEFE
jgi:hypothetical protein